MFLNEVSHLLSGRVVIFVPLKSDLQLPQCPAITPASISVSPEFKCRPEGRLILIMKTVLLRNVRYKPNYT